MASDFGTELIESLNQAVAHVKGKTKNGQVHPVSIPNVLALRESLSMSQQKFASTFTPVGDH